MEAFGSVAYMDGTSIWAADMLGDSCGDRACQQSTRRQSTGSLADDTDDAFARRHVADLQKWQAPGAG